MHIEKINISNPCPEDVELMDGEGSERYCHKCEKNVHNLSDLTREEAEALLAKNQDVDLCINYTALGSGEIDFFKDGYPRPSRSQLAGVKNLLKAAMLVPLIFTQPAILPAATALNAVYESVGTQDGPVDVMKKIMEAESKMLDRLKKDYGFTRIEAKYAGANTTVVDQVTFN